MRQYGPSHPEATGSLHWPLLATYAGAALYVLAPDRNRFPAVLACLVSFALLPALFARVRPIREPLICPLNWTFLIFFLQLVLVPLFLCYSGPYPSTLPALASDGAINTALLISCLAFAAFCVCYHVADRRVPAIRRPVSKAAERGGWTVRTGPLVGLYLGLGLLGVLVTFKDLGSLLHYFEAPAGNVGVQFGAGSNSVRTTAGLILRPFLGFACVAAWCAWISRNQRHSRSKTIAVTAVAIVAIVASYGTFSYERMGFLVGLVPVFAVYSFWLRPISVRWVLAAVVIGILFMAGLRTYRESHLSLGKVVSDPAVRRTLVRNTDLSNALQLSAGAPQFPAFLLEQTSYAEHPYYGKTLVSSVMSPVPSLGRSFRSSSGPFIYNRAIYGEVGRSDQNIPFQGELFINFDLPGVIMGYLLLGLVMQRLQRGFVQASTALQAFAWQYTATTVSLLVIGSLQAVSQSFLYFFWPIYLILLWSWLRPGTFRRYWSGARTPAESAVRPVG